MSDEPAPSRGRPERRLVDAARRHLENAGFRVWVDPDGRDYFDLVARRGAEVGLIEAKVRDARGVLAQALRRRVWGDWTAVVLGSERSARGLVARTDGTRAAPVGVWFADVAGLTVVRPARPWVGPSGEDPYADLRERFRRILDGLESGAWPADARWDGVVREVSRASGGRRFAEWRLDEPSE
jgi:hypothetical protein